MLNFSSFHDGLLVEFVLISLEDIQLSWQDSYWVVVVVFYLVCGAASHFWLELLLPILMMFSCKMRVQQVVLAGSLLEVVHLLLDGQIFELGVSLLV